MQKLGLRSSLSLFFNLLTKSPSLHHFQMLLHLISRILSPSFRSHKLSSSQLSTVSDTLYNHLQRCNKTKNLEKELTSMKLKLDSNCINEVIRRCNPQLGLRFFIWAGTQSSTQYRHSPYMYNKACDFLKIRTNPDLIKDVFDSYLSEECYISLKTMRVVLSLCKEARLANEALWVLRKFRDFDFEEDTVSYNLVIRLFVDKGDLNVAEKLMKEMESIDLDPDLITYTALINGYCNVGKIDEALRLVKEMRNHGCVVNTVTYSRILEGVCKSGDMETALELLREMEEGDCGPNAVSYTTVIQGFCEMKRVDEALLVLERMGERGCLPNRVTASVLVQGVLEDGKDVKVVATLINKLVKLRGVCLSECFSSVIVSLIRMKRWEEAEKLFRLMLERGVKPDGIACSLVFKELCLLERYQDCFLLYQELEKKGMKLSIDSDIYSALLLGLCEQGRSWEAAKLARSMLGKRMRLKASQVEKIIVALKKTGDEDLMRRLAPS